MTSPASETQITHLRRLWLYLLSGSVMAFLILPIFIVIPMSFSDTVYLEFPPREWSLRWYRKYFGSIEWRDATWISLQAAFFTVLLATPLGTVAAYGLHLSGSRVAGLIRTALATPLMVPVILIAIGIFFLFAIFGLNNTMLGLVLAHTTMALPFVVITVSSGLQTYDINQEKVARSLGATRIKAFLTVTLPQIRLSIYSGALFAFITSLDEVVIALFISGGPNATITRRMFISLRDQIDPTIAAISTILITLSVTLFLLSQLLGRRHRSS